MKTAVRRGESEERREEAEVRGKNVRAANPESYRI
jgi:hypothetical protein